MSDLTQSPAWRALVQHRATMTPEQSRALIENPARFTAMQIACDHLRFTFALHPVTSETLDLLQQLAAQQNLEAWRARLFGGEKINTSENRAALHMALRQPDDRPVLVDGRDVMPEIRAARTKISAFVHAVREGEWKGATGKPIRHIVNIGIGGSDLGPRLVVRALDAFTSGPSVHFVANADAFEVLNVLKNLNAEETLFVVVSKTFTTQETLLNAQTARRWLAEKLGEAAVARHFVAVSTALGEVGKFGIATAFPIWDWVGGRTSLWSAVGLSIELAIGTAHYENLLAGAAAMDRHFLSAPFAQNMPVVMALLGVWHRSFCGMPALAILPYSERLRDLPRYVQQLEMESNGKSVDRGGARVAYATAPVIFGESGTVGQHSFHQWLHQGTTVTPADFIGVVQDDLGAPLHHRALTANMVAQAAALALGHADAASPFDAYEGGRPVSLLLLERLDPHGLGLLLALYEHKVFVQSVLWNLNPFDQPGVELGKKIARALEKSEAVQGMNAALLQKLFALCAPSR